MRKSTLVISAILTAALLFALYSLVSAYRQEIQISAPATVAVTLVVDNNTQTQPTDIPAVNSTTTNITIYDAAALAVKVLGRSDLYTVENTQLNGVDVYLATFKSGDVLYISLDGKVLSASKVAGLAITQPTSHSGK